MNTKRGYTSNFALVASFADHFIYYMYYITCTPRLLPFILPSDLQLRRGHPLDAGKRSDLRNVARAEVSM